MWFYSSYGKENKGIGVIKCGTYFYLDWPSLMVEHNQSLQGSPSLWWNRTVKSAQGMIIFNDK